MKRILIAFFLISNILAFCQDKPGQFNSTQRDANLIQLENKLKNQQIVIDSLQLKIEELFKANKKASELYKISEEVYSKTKDSISMSDRIINVFIGIIAFLVTLSGYTVFQSKRDIKNAVENLKNDAKVQIADVAKSNVEMIEKLVAKHNKEQHLLQNSKILIINKEDTNRDHGLEMILKRFKSTVTFIDTIDFKNIDIEQLKDFDAVILDNINYEDEAKNWDFAASHKKELINIARATCENNNAFLFFGKKDGEFSKKLPEHSHLINFANQSATLFANLIDLLDYRNLLRSI